MATEQYHHHHQQQSAVTQRPLARQAIKVTTAAIVGLSCVALSALTMTGTVLGLVVMTPLLVLFSPVLVPATLALVLAGMGLLFSGGCGAAALAAVSWVYSYVKGRHPVGAHALDRARHVVEDAASEIKDKVIEVKDRVTEGVADAGTEVKEIKARDSKTARKGQQKAQQES